MSSLVRLPELTDNSVLGSESDKTAHREMAAFFRFLPPERVGLKGEYDHSGLAKRVDRALHQTFKSQAVERLNITQRGCVVVLTGYAPNAYLLQQVIELAASVNGASSVETLGVKLAQ